MCGILFQICYSSGSLLKDEGIHARIRNRGPDCINNVVITPLPGITINFCSAVLWMQGAYLTPQPVENDHGILLYNGDIFDETWNSEKSDTQMIMDKLSDTNERCNEEHILRTLKTLKGPYSLIYYDKLTKFVFFARDRIGRSSLLLSKTESTIIISSVLSRDYQCVEIPATNIYGFNIDSQKLHLFPWTDTEKSREIQLDDWLKNLKLQQSLSDAEFKVHFGNDIDLNDDDEIINYIEAATHKLPLKTQHQHEKLTFMKNLLESSKIKEIAEKVKELLEKSVKVRLQRQPNKCKNCLVKLDDEEIKCSHCTVGILFSGGLDCTVLAVLADKYLPEDQHIDLINVAFAKDDFGSYEVPDRLTGRHSFEELKRLCPTRKWKFKEVDVPKIELEQYQESVIADLVFPRQTILDESLGSALWFAARGKDENYTSSCRVLLVGSGADELFGGYTRHRNAYKRRGWIGLSMELLLDWKRISIRNLSRDNRVICDHGRQPRMPYLDEDFTDFVLKLKPWLKCFPSEHLDQGLGDKLMLRLVAYCIGLREAAVLPKRALQFGSRIANKKENGADISQRFLKRAINP